MPPGALCSPGAEMQLHWWGILVRDRRLFSPGAIELAQWQAGAASYRGIWGASVFACWSRLVVCVGQ